MTLTEAVAHIDHPVLIHEPGRPGRVADAEISAVDEGRRMVQLRVRRRTAPYDFLPRPQWWAPCHLSIPAWWMRRQETR